MSIHDSRDWKATESTDFDGSARVLTVTGDVQVGASNEEPELAPAVPPGFNPAILILTLATRSDGEAGAQVLTWKPVQFIKPIVEDQYSQIEVRGHTSIRVEKQIS